MKKRLHLLFAALLSLTAFTAGAYEIGDLDYDFTTYTGNRAVVTGLSSQGRGKTSLSLTIPSCVTYNGTTYRVYGIKTNAFANQQSLTGVTIRWGARNISSGAFQNCTNITYVRLPSSVDYFGSSAFAGCSKLQTVYYSAFQLPSTCSSTSWPSNSGMKLYINREATASDFTNSSAWNKFTVNQTANDAYDYYFGSDGMNYCVTIGKTDDQGPGARDAVITYWVPQSGYTTLTGRDSSHPAATDASGITYRWTKIGKQATNASSSSPNTTLTSIDMDRCSYLTTIEGSAFAYLTALTTLKIPASCYSITLNFTYGCTALTAYTVNDNNNSLSTYAGSLYNKSKTTLYRVPEGKSGVMSYPESLTTLQQDCHENCKKITRALLPYGVTTIGNYSFYNCNALTHIRVPSSVKTIDTYAFARAYGLTSLYVNCATPPSITASNMFSGVTLSNVSLYVPYGKTTDYSNAGWTGFKNYNSNDNQAFDIGGGVDGYVECYSVISSGSKTYNGSTYPGGFVRVVGTNISPTGNSTRTIMNSVSMNSKSFKVTSIGNHAFKSSVDFKVAGSQYVDTILRDAFYNQPLTEFNFSPNLKYINSNAFYGTKLTGTIALPYGTTSVYANAFGNGKYSRIIIPSSIVNLGQTFCKNTTTLTEIIFNSWRGQQSNWSFDFGTVPSTCKIRVPVNYVKQFKNHPSWSSRASYIDAGAYDFVGYWGDDDKISNGVYNNSVHHFTVISTSSTTHNGTTYAGKVKYVFSPNNKNYSQNYAFVTAMTDKTCTTGHKTYLVTELGDSCLANSTAPTIGTIPSSVTKIGHDAFYSTKITNSNLVLPAGLTYIGEYAFYNTQIAGEVKIPASVSTIGKYAFNSNKLNSLFFPDASLPSTLGISIWGNNASDFVCWVPNSRASEWYTKANGWGSTYSAKLAPWINPTATSMMFSSVLPVNLAGSAKPITAYYASNYDKSKQEVTLTKANQAPENTGLLLVDLTKNTEYRIKRPTSSVSAPMTNYFIGTPSSSVNIKNQTVGYFWDGTLSVPHFVKPSNNYYSGTGSAYLKLSSAEAGTYTDIYSNLWPKPAVSNKGDINNDGKIDIEDLNILINILIGKDQANKYGGRANVDGIGSVDTGDINALINIMLTQN